MRKIIVSAILAGAAAILTTASAQPDPAAVRESILQVTVLNGDEIERLGSGFAVAEGYVLTAAHLVANEDRIVVVPSATGAEFVARIVYSNTRADLALLAVRGLVLPPLKFAVDGFEPGRRIFSGGVWRDAGAEAAAALAEGSVGKHNDLPGADDDAAVPLMEHNAMIPAAGYGGPVLNECGEVVGLNRGEPDVPIWRLRRGEPPESVVHAVRVSLLEALLQRQGTAFTRSGQSCVSALAVARSEAEEAATLAEETRRQLEQAQQEREQASARVNETEARVGDLEEQYEAAVREGNEQAEALRAELEAAREERQAAREEQQAARGAAERLEGQVAELEQRLRQEAEADRQRLIITIAIASVLVAVVAIVGFAAARRRSRQVTAAREEAARAQRAAAEARARPLEQASPYPDCLLTGKTSEGNTVSVKIPGALLGGDGAVVGRSPRNATLLIDDPTLSREHARFFGDRDAIYVEDLKTTNGTRANGRSLVSGTPVRVSHGDSLELGAVKVEMLLDR